ncbi:hypothetical protein TorRG33x02_133470 [Trema orientale]|uniref:Uncharacterized protein n=2 Tax=Cannabaceae TaxID=3481 RepID=A0A2P5BFS6_PARAD|nr:hypothetical protein PanWU01x14_242750 [Parasponia andersonii]PON90941.1 hypothetical protein TorRG33x02_133470 [Trema orientale]
MSIEALAMAGLSYSECGIALKEWEPHSLEQPPEHLLLEGTEIDKGPPVLKTVKVDGELLKAEIRKWAKAVVSIKESAAQSQVRNLFSCGEQIRNVEFR